MTTPSNISAPDLTQRPPRSVRSRLGGYGLLPRMLDKGRATIAGKNGEFHYHCPVDQHILNFLGLDPKALREQLATGKGDGEVLDWINANVDVSDSASIRQAAESMTKDFGHLDILINNAGVM